MKYAPQILEFFFWCGIIIFLTGFIPGVYMVVTHQDYYPFIAPTINGALIASLSTILILCIDGKETY